MNPFQDIRKWNRKNFSEHSPGLTLRAVSEIETDRDLQKPVQQLLCDVHEESLNSLPEKADGETDDHWNLRLAVLQLQRLVGAQKRMVSLQTVSAFQTSRTNSLVMWLTVIIVIQTFLLIWLTIFPSQKFAPNTRLIPPSANSSTHP